MMILYPLIIALGFAGLALLPYLLTLGRIPI